MNGGKVEIFGKEYTLKRLQQIGQGKEEDDVLEFIKEELDYICDNFTVRFFEDYRWLFRNKKTDERVDVYVKYYPDKDTIKFVDGQDSVYYIKKKENDSTKI